MFFLYNFSFVINILLKNLISNLYFILLLFFLIPIVYIVTSQIVQLFLLESSYSQVSKYKINNNLASYYLSIVKILMAKKLWFQSIQLLESINSAELKDSYIYFHTMGFIYYKMGEYVEAKKYYLKTISMKKDYLLALRNLAKIYELEKEYSLAFKTYSTILLYDTDNLLAKKKVLALRNRDSRI